MSPFLVLVSDSATDGLPLLPPAADTQDGKKV